MVAAIRKQAGELIYMSGTDFYYESMVELAARLSKIAPAGRSGTGHGGNSGAEAVECALKLARYHTKRQNVTAFFWAFRRTDDGRALADRIEACSRSGVLVRFVPGVTHVRYPYVYRSGSTQSADGFALGCARFIEEKLFKTIIFAGGSGRDLRRAGAG